MRTKIKVTFGDFITNPVGIDVGTITCEWDAQIITRVIDCEMVDIHGIEKVAEMVTRLKGVELAEVLDDNSPDILYRGYAR